MVVLYVVCILLSERCERAVPATNISCVTHVGGSHIPVQLYNVRVATNSFCFFVKHVTQHSLLDFLNEAR